MGRTVRAAMTGKQRQDSLKDSLLFTRVSLYHFLLMLLSLGCSTLLPGFPELNFFIFFLVKNLLVLDEPGPPQSSELWKQARQEVRQHWFIHSYIAAYTYTGTVHVLSSVAGVHPAGLTANQGCRQVSTGLPRALASAGRRRGQRSNLHGGAR
jgi:hypothetical protein